MSPTLPFTRAQFIEVFVQHNLGVWPLQIVACVLGGSMLAWLIGGSPSRAASRVLATALAAQWLAAGAIYHGTYFAAINPAARGFAALFVLQGLLFLHAGLGPSPPAFGGARGLRAGAGWALALYSLLVYPAVGLAQGARWFELPAFGLTPCPVTLFSVGLLLLAAPVPPRRLLVVPLVWCAVGGSAAVLLDMPQDWALWAAAAALIALLAARRHPAAAPAAPGSAPAPRPPADARRDRS